MTKKISSVLFAPPGGPQKPTAVRIGTVVTRTSETPGRRSVRTDYVKRSIVASRIEMSRKCRHDENLRFFSLIQVGHRDQRRCAFERWSAGHPGVRQMLEASKQTVLIAL